MMISKDPSQAGFFIEYSKIPNIYRYRVELVTGLAPRTIQRFNSCDLSAAHW